MQVGLIGIHVACSSTSHNIACYGTYLSKFSKNEVWYFALHHFGNHNSCGRDHTDNSRIIHPVTKMLSIVVGPYIGYMSLFCNDLSHI